MTLSVKTEKETAAYRTEPFRDLTVQDALTIIAFYAAQMEPEYFKDGINRIEAVVENYPEFVEKKENIIKRIYKFVNSMLAAGNHVKAVEIASDFLTPQLQKKAFELAAQIALPDKVLTDEKQAVLDTLKTKLSIDSEFSQKTIEKFIE